MKNTGHEKRYGSSLERPGSQDASTVLRSPRVERTRERQVTSPQLTSAMVPTRSACVQRAPKLRSKNITAFRQEPPKRIDAGTSADLLRRHLKTTVEWYRKRVVLSRSMNITSPYFPSNACLILSTARTTQSLEILKGSTPRGRDTKF